MKVPTAVLILPTGTYRAEEYLAAAARLGVEVVVASERRQAMAAKMGEHFLEVPLDDPERAGALIAQHGRKFPLDAVIAVDDEGSLAAAIASAELALAHSPVEAVRITRDKSAMRARFAEVGVAQPRHLVVDPGSPGGVVDAALAIGLPVVVKPCSLSGSRGVIRADTVGEAETAARRIGPILEAAGEDPRSRLLVEEYVEGREVAVEAICTRGVLSVVTIFDKPAPLTGPYFEETLYVAPAALSPAAEEAVTRATAEAVAAIGITDGPVHAELRLADRDGLAPRPFLIEVAARTIGGRCSKALSLVGGASLEELVVARAVGLPGPQPRLQGPAGVLMIPIARTGVLRAVHNLEDVRAIPGITGVEVTIPTGRRVQALPEGDRYLGFVFATGADHEAVQGALTAAMERLDVEIADDPSEPSYTVVE